MAVLRKGNEFNDFIFEPEWSSNWYVSGNAGVVGLWFRPYREQRPDNWDRVGYLALEARTNPNQIIVNLESRLALFERFVGYLFPPALVGTELRLSLVVDPWIGFLSADWGELTFAP